MNYQYLKTTQIVLLAAAAIYQRNIVSFILTIALSIYPFDRYCISTICSTAITIIAYYPHISPYAFNIIYLLPLAINTLLCYLLRKKSFTSSLSETKKMTIFVLCFGLTTMNGQQYTAKIQLFIFFVFLLLNYLEQFNLLSVLIKIMRFILAIEIIILISIEWRLIQFYQDKEYVYNHNEWYFISFIISVLYSTFISCKNKIYDKQKQKSVSSYEMQIQMKDWSLKIQNKSPSFNNIDSISKSQRDNNSDVRLSIQKDKQKNKQKRQDNEQLQNKNYQDFNQQKQIKQNKKVQQNNKNNNIQQNKDNKQIDYLKQSYIISYDKDKKRSSRQNIEVNSRSIKQSNISNNQEQQSQSLNMILVIPFCLHQLNLLEIPIYMYLLSLQWDYQQRKWIFVLMLCSIGVILAIIDVEYYEGIYLRILAVLLVAKDLQGGYQLTQVIKTIWLRGSFIFVLSILFWFSLLTVNIFHLLFIGIILLFITRDSKPNNESFRHRNWKYLLLIFNIFIILRLFHCIFIHQNLSLYGDLKSLLQIIGISFSYLPESSIGLFNLIPLAINTIIGLQYLTYHSKIYFIHKQSSILGAYKAVFDTLIDSLTVIYYKLLPWLSYFAILTILLILQFSLSAFILITWILIIFSFNLLSKNEQNTYKRLYFFWLIYARLTSLQIVLRYIFQFVKFDLFHFLHSLPLFNILLKYEVLFGLAIRDQDQVYFKTITKFQLMVSLDLMAIFIAFLVTEYYRILIKYNEINIKPQLQNTLIESQQKIRELYTNYIDFKLTVWIKNLPILPAYKLINYFCKTYHQLFFPLLGLYACTHYSILMAFYLFICIRYFLALNYHYYKTHVLNKLGRRIMQILFRWKNHGVGRQAQNLVKQMQGIQQEMQQKKIYQHNKLRKYIILITIFSIMLTYLSRELQQQDLVDIIGQELSVSLRWWLLIGGCNHQKGFQAHISKILLILLILQMKCCWFINKFQITAKNYQPEEVDQIIKDVLTSNNQKDCEQSIDFDGQSGDIQGIEWQQNSYITQGQYHAVGQKEVNQIRMSLILSMVKLIQRAFVMVLIFISIVLVSHPFGIIYLLCAILLNYLGSLSIKVISRMISSLIIIQYILIITNYSNSKIFHVNIQYSPYQQQTILNRIFQLPLQWENYITFGKIIQEYYMIALSWILLVSYQFYFLVLQKGWLMVLKLLIVGAQIGQVGQRIIQHIKHVYQYGLTYSPLFIMLLCLGIYLMDFTTTNMLLTLLTVGFIFISFMLRDYKQSRHFWRTYFIVLQLMIVCFMLIFSLIQLPMLSKYASKWFFSAQKLHTQIAKAILLFILQLGLDLTSSYHFDRALKEYQRSKKQIQLKRLVIAYKNNDYKIQQRFRQLKQQQQLLQTIQDVQQFQKQYVKNPQQQFEYKGQSYQTTQSWIDVFLSFLPNLIDQYLLLNRQQIKNMVKNQNFLWIKWKQHHNSYEEHQLYMINDSYIDQFGQLEGIQLKNQIQKKLQQISILQDMRTSNMKERDEDLGSSRVQRQLFQQEEQYERYSQSRSYIHEERPYQSKAIIQQMRKSIKKDEQKQQLLYLLLIESVISNWQYITYILLLLLHIRNQGILTFFIVGFVFFFGVISSYQANKLVWSWLIWLVMIPLMFKYSITIGIIELDSQLIYFLIGNNTNSILLEYLCIIFIIGECIILKMIGHYEQTTEEIQCMKMGLIRNIINNKKQDEKEYIFKLLDQSNTIPSSCVEMVFGVSQCKPGYDYSTLITTIQLTVLLWVFLFYDRMAIRQEINFYQMIQYNQFSSGMVALTLTQLFILLVQRFIAIVDLKSSSHKWMISLILKFILLIFNFLLVQGVILIYFPLSSGKYQGNIYVTILLIISLIGFLVQALQIKNGLDQSSRGFMDRYTWYNGFVYIGYRAIPFLFQFKAFSDWTFTKTALRIFDWIRLEEIFGRLYVAKCNSLFMSGKVLGSKIQWWKKLLMGYPLLLSIILLLFGPLVLFSNLNPLASLNDVTAGYLEVVLKVNKTNEYPLYTNSKITDINRANPNLSEFQIKNYDIDPESIQILRLQQFSDQYWQISQGSYYKLLDQPIGSLYQLIVRAKFNRNFTGTTSLFVLKTYQIPSNRIQELKSSLIGKNNFCTQDLLSTFLRLDNNNGIHELSTNYSKICLRAVQGVRAPKQYWIAEGGFQLRIASDKYTKAISGYSVMSFYISIILVIANYFRFLFQGSVHMIITSDIPYPDPVLALCNAIYRARRQHDLVRQQQLFWLIIDILRSPDNLKALTGNYLDARLKTTDKQPQYLDKKNI